MERSIHRRHLSGGRTWYAQIHAPLDLFCLARLLAPQHVVEVGVSSGVSSAHFLMGLGQRRSRLHSIDLPVVQTTKRLKKGETPVSVPPGRSSGWAIPDGLRRGWDLRLGPSQELLPTLVAELPRIDLFLHDDLHTPEHLAWELATIRPKLRRGSVVLADNSNWTGNSFAQFAETVGAPVEARRETDLLGLRMP